MPKYINVRDFPSEYKTILKRDVEKICIEGTNVVLYKKYGLRPYTIKCSSEEAAQICYNYFVNAKEESS